MKILYIEDIEDNVFVLKNRLTRAGFMVVIATDGAQGVAMAASERPDLILMDLSLPKLDGLAATRRIRGHRASAKIPIVAVSAHDSPQSRDEALAAGCNDYVTKPIDFEQLNSVVTRLLH